MTTSVPVHSTFHLAQRKTGTPILTPHLAIHFLELPKLHSKDNAGGAAETDGGSATGGHS